MSLTHEAEGVFRLPVHTPFPVEPTNVYFLVGEGLALFDTGIGVETTWREVTAGLRALGARPDDVDVVVVSHAHVDHHGLADRFPRAEVLVGRPDLRGVSDVGGDVAAQLPVLAALFAAWGVPDAIRSQVGSLLSFADFARPLPNARGIGDGALVEGFGSPFVALATPGHTLGHQCLLRPEDGVLLSGDHLLPTISPNPAVYTERTPVSSGLPDYLRSLRRLLERDIRLVLPGHGVPFAFSARRIGEILAHHEQRLETVRDLTGDGVTVFEVAAGLFPQRDFFEVFLGLREAYGHLEVLRESGVVERHSVHRGEGSRPGSGSGEIDVYVAR